MPEEVSSYSWMDVQLMTLLLHIVIPLESNHFQHWFASLVCQPGFLLVAGDHRFVLRNVVGRSTLTISREYFCCQSPDSFVFTVDMTSLVHRKGQVIIPYIINNNLSGTKHQCKIICSVNERPVMVNLFDDKNAL